VDVTPAKAGAQYIDGDWIPAFAGMTALTPYFYLLTVTLPASQEKI